jgi:phage baseplate assembly protein W
MFMSFDLSLVRGDIKVQDDGALSIVTGNSKLRQDIIKILLTELGDNKFHPNYGSHVGALQIGHYADKALINLDLQSSAMKAVRNLMALQRSQSRRQALSSGEKIIEVLSVLVERDSLDPRMYNIFVSVLTEELTEVRNNITVRIA